MFDLIPTIGSPVFWAFLLPLLALGALLTW